MAKYTVTLATVVKMCIKLFDFNYPFYDETKKEEFEKLFIKHFYFREIGQETVERFKHYLELKFNEILPYYNEVLSVATLKYDLINNYDLTETLNRTTTNNKIASNTGNQNTTNSKSNSIDSTTTHAETTQIDGNESLVEDGTLDRNSSLVAGNKRIESDTPSGLLAMDDISSNLYASKANIENLSNANADSQITSANKTSTNSNTTTTDVTDKIIASSGDAETMESIVSARLNEDVSGGESYTLKRIGNIGVDAPSDMLKKHLEFQNNIQRAYIQFFNECEDLFMQIF